MMMAAFHSGCSTAQEDRFGRTVQYSDGVPLKKGDGQKRDLLQADHLRRVGAKMPDEFPIGLILGSVQPEQFNGKLVEQHIVVFVNREDAFGKVFGGHVQTADAGRKIA